MTTLGARLARVRRGRGITQTELAVALGDRYSQSMISQIETGRSSLLLDGLVNAAQELEVSTDYLLGLSDDPTPALERLPLGPGPQVGLAEVTRSADPSDEVLLPQVAGIPATNQGSVVPSEFESFPISSACLTKHQINPRNAGIIEVKGQAMFPALPNGSVVLVDLARRWLRHNLVYLIIINPWTPDSTYEVRRLRGEDQRDFQWCTDFYLDLQDGGSSWPADSWRRDLWKDEIRANVLLSRSLSTFAPFPHGNEVIVLGQVRGKLHMFDDEGW